ncbi:armadillo repeat-containing X-linked protein 2-like isoform X2 [Eleutherodactylus coqui]|uniref:armadillo repeat-containing X-linked protein 2-like n=1 Tax=Eleutherodactylus coqui TaxID=57060 RepID=UPI0034633C80
MEAILEKIRAEAEERGLDWLVQLSGEALGAAAVSTAAAAEAGAAGARAEAAGGAEAAAEVRSRRTGAGPAAAAPAGLAKERPRRARAPERLSPEHAPSRRQRLRSASPAPPRSRLPPATPTGRGSRAGRTPAKRRGAAGSARPRAERGAGPSAAQKAKSLEGVGGCSPGGASEGEQPCNSSSDGRPAVSRGPAAESSGRRATATEVAYVSSAPRRSEAVAVPAERSQPGVSRVQEEQRQDWSAAGGSTAPTQPVGAVPDTGAGCGEGGEEVPVSNLERDGRPALVWILGDSYVFWGAERAGVRPNGRQLRFQKSEAIVRWMGIRGMTWGSVLEEVERRVRWDRAPEVLVIHVGGNDLGKRRFRDLSRDIRYDCLRLQASYPGTVVVWSEIVPRKVWRGAQSEKGLNRARVKLNREVSRFLGSKGGVAARHIDLEKGVGNYWRSDGVHLNDIGIDLWTEGLQEGIERALLVWGAAQAQGGRASLAVAGEGEGPLEPV